jgi:thiol:disulfide interchange protein DsbA
LKERVPTRDANKVEVVEAFSYGCTNCYEMEGLLREWQRRQAGDVDFSMFHAVWNPAMALYARGYFACKKMDILGKVHSRVFKAIVLEHQQVADEHDFARLLNQYSVDEAEFLKIFRSSEVGDQVKAAESRTKQYNLGSVPEIVVNGKYRIDPMRAGGRSSMLDVVDFLVEKERALLKR